MRFTAALSDDVQAQELHWQKRVFLVVYVVVACCRSSDARKQERLRFKERWFHCLVFIAAFMLGCTSFSCQGIA